MALVTEMAIDTALAVEHFAAMLRVPTVSTRDDANTDWTFFARFRSLVDELYPLVRENLDKEIIASHSLVYHWDVGVPDKPIVLMAHQDVVPAHDEGWTHPPFGGVVADDAVWGRGAIDDKGVLVSILEAVEGLLRSGVVPARDVYLIFGHNEEVGGDGIPQVVHTFRERGIVPGVVIDEGGGVAGDAFPGVDATLAVLGTAEKGILDLQLTAKDPGGHASMPGRKTATARLARAITRVDHHKFPARLTEPTVDLLTNVGVHAKGPLGTVLSRTDTFGPLLARVLPRAGALMNAMCRTTAVATVLEGSSANNVMAETARAVLDIRILPGDTVNGTVERIRKTIRDNDIQLDVLGATEPSPVSRTDDEVFARLRQVIADTFPGAIVSPFLLVGATDARHMARISEYVYRFYPFELDARSRALIHSTDERLSITGLRHGIEFFSRLIRDWR
ncbi:MULTISPECIES: M20/M25/M40 family metallo-hydrolase [Rhodococcus]|uniref:M20/M25/M40 family metallo-hydrolase n=2 Tax=Nocardiaceae TaxID=85025 RepID=A0AAE4V1M5_9NOCA|nr:MULTISPECIES: M20/M25/M40 family metallo-hydrolase [Rhodococcus]MDV7267165.1 M20/M25/M40 family metallo-hydrolase [Rhodococcus oxybenzonivorans]MDV8105537.1 M20/M25/M40 family metallo-hydrolase [Rhodococcus sp. IEGM 69]